MGCLSHFQMAPHHRRWKWILAPKAQIDIYFNWYAPTAWVSENENGMETFTCVVHRHTQIFLRISECKRSFKLVKNWNAISHDVEESVIHFLNKRLNYNSGNRLSPFLFQHLNDIITMINCIILYVFIRFVILSKGSYSLRKSSIVNETT